MSAPRQGASSPKSTPELERFATKAAPPRAELGELFTSSPSSGKPAPPGARRRLGFQKRILIFSLAIGIPLLSAIALLLWNSSYSLSARWAFFSFLLGLWIVSCFALRERILRPLRTLSNMVAAMREDDFSFRAQGARRDDAMGELILELNALSDILQSQRHGALEAVALLKKVLMEIDIAVFAFDPSQRLRIVNRAGEQLMLLTSEKMLGSTAAELHLETLIGLQGPQTLHLSFPGKVGRWAIQHTSFREAGVPHELLLISDLSRALREEERQAWQRLIRVLGHEINNSLAPIKSIAGTIRTIVARNPTSPDWHEDVVHGLDVIEGRANALGRFLQAYTVLAKLPPPSFKQVDIPALVRRAVSVETRLPVEVKSSEAITVDADPDQLEQLLINIVRNAADAALDPTLPRHLPVEISWKRQGSFLHIHIVDEGWGLANSKNLFVPFFTTKTEGSGIGLVLSRQIAEAHGGSLTLKNREHQKGCDAEIQLPIKRGVAPA